MKQSLKRWSALLLALVMIAGLLPAAAPSAEAHQETYGTLDHTDVISLPITIRNHAADGMLFEWDGIGLGTYEEKPFRNPYNTSDITEPIPFIGSNIAMGQLFCNDWNLALSNLNKDGIEYHYGETYDSRYAHIVHNGWYEHVVWNQNVGNALDTRYMVIRFRTPDDLGSDLLYIKRYDGSNFAQAGIDLHTKAASPIVNANDGTTGPYKLVAIEDGWTTIAVDLNDSALWTDSAHAYVPGNNIRQITLGFGGAHTLDISFIAFFIRLEHNGNPYSGSFRYCGYDFINQDYCYRMDDPTITMVEPIPAAGLNVLTAGTGAVVTVDDPNAAVYNHSTANTKPIYDDDKYVTITAGSADAAATVWSGEAVSGRYAAIRCRSAAHQELQILVNGSSVKSFYPDTVQEGVDGVLELKDEGDWRTVIFDLGTNYSAASLGLGVSAGNSVDLAYLGLFRDYTLELTSGYNYATDAHVFVFEDYSYRHDRIAYGDADVEQYQVYKNNGAIRFKQWNGSSFVNFDPTVAINIENNFVINGSKAELNGTAENGEGEEVTGIWRYYKLTDTGNDRGIGARQILLNSVGRSAGDLKYAVVSYCVADSGSAQGDTVPMYVMLDTQGSGFDYSKVTLGFFDAVADGRWHVDVLDLSECVSRAPNGETYSYKHDTFNANTNYSISRIGIADGWAVYGLEFQLAYMAFFPTAEAAEQYGNAYSEANKRFNSFQGELTGDTSFPVITNAFKAEIGQLQDNNLSYNNNNWESSNGNKRFRLGSNNGFELIDPDYAYNNNQYYSGLPNYYSDMGFGEWVRNDSSYTNYNVNGSSIGFYDNETRNLQIENKSGIYGSSTNTYGYIMGLTERNLVDGRVVYRKEVVEYLAQLLQNALCVPRTFMWDNVLYYSANYVQGDVDGERFGYYDEQLEDGSENVNAMFPRDYAGWLRFQLGVTNRDGSLTGNRGTLGEWSLTEAKGADLITHRDHIETWTDAAYYMLNTLFLDSAGEEVPEYKYLQLTRESSNSKDGEESYYVFDTRYTNVMFDFDKGVISNNSPYVDSDDAIADTDDNDPNHRVANYAFLPILRELPEFQSTFPYLKDTGIANKFDGADSYYNRDYNFTLECHGTFTYYADKNLFFEFDGDDDVYLYVDGRCVLDLGGGHRPANQKIYINDYVEYGILQLEENRDYTFDFYFMERHGTGSNLRIQTNMEVYSDNIETHKTASQDGIDLPDYSIADFTQPVSYSFSITNNFDPMGKLTKFSFKDNDVDFYAGYDMQDFSHHAESQLSDLTVTVTDSSGATVYTGTPSTVLDLAAMLTDPGNRGGLAYGETVTLSGVKHTIGAGLSAFSNTVISRAGKHSGVAYHHLLNDNSAAHYFAWKSHEIEIPISEILKHRSPNDASTWEDIYRCDVATYKPISTSEVTVDWDNGVIKVKYDAVGTRRLAFTSDGISQDIGRYLIQVDVHVMDAADSVYVLDFDGTVKLGSESDYSIAANDVSSLAGVDTKVRYEAFTDISPEYDEIEHRVTLGGELDLWPKHIPASYSVNVNIDPATSTASGALNQTVVIGNSMTDVVVRPINPFSNPISAPSYTGSGVMVSEIYDRIYLKAESWWTNADAVTDIEFYDADTGSYTPRVRMTQITFNTLWSAAIPSGNITGFRLSRSDGTNAPWNTAYHDLESGYNAYKVSGDTITAFENYASFRISGTPTSDVTVTFDGAPGSGAENPVRAGETEELVSPPYYYRNGQEVTTVPEGGVEFENRQGSFIALLPAEDDLLPKLNFTPGGIMDGAATIWLTSRVYEEDPDIGLNSFRGDGEDGDERPMYLGNVDITKEVEMFQAVTVVPANVVYYEDINAGINIHNDVSFEVHWTQENASPDQSATQNGAYGYDVAYAACSGYSGNTVTEIKFTGNKTLADFDFTGTGFDLFSRCEKDGPTLVLLVYNAENELVRTVYVATEFSNYNTSPEGTPDAMYQVPVSSVHGLEYGSYHVVLNGAGRVDMSNWSIKKEGSDYYMIETGVTDVRWKMILPTPGSGAPILYQKQTKSGGSWNDDGTPTDLNPASVEMRFWLDGLRVYGALSEDDQNTYYNQNEANATFVEVRDQLIGGKGIALNYTNENVNFTTQSFVTTVELHNSPSAGFPLNENGGADLSYYFLVGPNNEIYLNGDETHLQAVVFNLVPEESSGKTFQIAAKLLDSTSFGNSGNGALLRYLTTNGWKNIGVQEGGIGSGMELYYELDPTLCPQRNGYFTVIIAAGGSENVNSMVSLTKLKYKGWSFREDYSTEKNFVTDTIDGREVIVGITSVGAEVLPRIISLIASDPQSLPHPVRPFGDVPADAWYADAVDWAVENGVTAGTSAGTFSPNLSCTRSQIVTFLWKAAGAPEPTVTASFEDVPENIWYAKAVSWALENGITAGTSETTFSPNAKCTRAQAATFLWRYAGSPKSNEGCDFTDVPADAWYAQAVAWAVEKGITVGTGNGCFSPDAICTRAQIVTFLYRNAEK